MTRTPCAVDRPPRSGRVPSSPVSPSCPADGRSDHRRPRQAARVLSDDPRLHAAAAGSWDRHGVLGELGTACPHRFLAGDRRSPADVGRPGLPAMYVASRLPARTWRWLAVPALLGSIALLALVMVPGIGVSVNGNRNWLNFCRGPRCAVGLRDRSLQGADRSVRGRHGRAGQGRAPGLPSRHRGPSARHQLPDRRGRAALQRGPRLRAAPHHAPRHAPRASAGRQGSVDVPAGAGAGAADGRDLPGAGARPGR